MLARISRETLLGTVYEHLMHLLTVQLSLHLFLPLLLHFLIMVLLKDHFEVAGGVHSQWHAELRFVLLRCEDLVHTLHRAIDL